jgi:glutamyl-tRNA synthetase
MNPTRKPGQVVTRFAPSPTGYLHIGGARTALFNWAFARRHQGVFILRMEDTDKARSTPEATRRILEDLQWLGIHWDEGPDPRAADPYAPAAQIGAFGPYFQSQRDALYQQYLARLRDAGRVYDDNGAVRFRMPEHDITVHDQVLGDVTIKREELEDFIIVKSETSGGGPTFHFANVVDDATMGVTHVLRAQEHLMNTPKHVALFEALGLQPPVYAHMPLIFNPDGSKMSKRDKAKTARKAAQDWVKQPGRGAAALAALLGQGATAQGSESLGFEAVGAFLEKKSDDTGVAAAIARALGVTLPEIDVHDFRVSGYMPDVLCNYVSLLGWSPPGGGVERFDKQFLVENFAVEKIGRSNARFDRDKLFRFNADTLMAMPPDVFRATLLEFCRVYAPQVIARLGEGERFTLFAAAYQPRARTLREPTELGKFLLIDDEAIVFDAKAVAKVLDKDQGAGRDALRQILPVLQGIGEDQWHAAAIDTAVQGFATNSGLGMGKIGQPLRVALTGSTVSPAIHDTLAMLGRSATLNRITRCLAQPVAGA